MVVPLPLFVGSAKQAGEWEALSADDEARSSNGKAEARQQSRQTSNGAGALFALSCLSSGHEQCCF